jgi:hypothetical protein
MATIKPEETERSERSVSQPHILRAMWGLAIGILFAVLFIYLIKANIGAIWATGLASQISLVTFLFALFLWMVVWIAFDAYETEVLDATASKWMREHERLPGFVLVTVMPMVFAAMAASITTPGLLVILMATVVLGATIGDSMIIAGLYRVSQEPNRQIRKDILDYYLTKPHMVIHCIQLFIITIAGAVYGLTQGSSRTWAVYAVLAASIYVNEAILWTWRIRRMRRRAREELRQV